ncbi:MAG TPA: hypothetical protein VNW68_03300 [Candidatus Limnocylindria bacterium]|nr:hypothetical protein [Candidatus Limnocylindria bacterium]
MEQKRKESRRATAEQEMASLLDDPSHPDQPSPVRSALYFAAMLGVGLIGSLVLMVILAGGR